MTKSFLIILAILVCPLTFSNSIAAAKPRIVASIYPLAHFAGQVGGEHIEVVHIMPPGSEPHEFEPTAGDIKKVYGSNVFLFNGAGVDPWAERLKPQLMKKGVTVVEMISHSSFVTLRDTDKNRQTDPHIWLDPLLALTEVETIRDTLIKADPLHAMQYRENSRHYTDALKELHKKYTEGLKSCKKRDIIVQHNAFSYLSKRYNINSHSIMGTSTEEEPSPRKMTDITRVALRQNIKYIFIEQLSSPKLARTIAREIGAKTLVLNPLGGLTAEDLSKGRTYISVMEDNLHNLRIAMECE